MATIIETTTEPVASVDVVATFDRPSTGAAAPAGGPAGTPVHIRRLNGGRGHLGLTGRSDAHDRNFRIT